MAAVEPNLNMRKLGKFLTAEQFKNEILWVDSLAMIPSGERGKFDFMAVQKASGMCIVSVSG